MNEVEQAVYVIRHLTGWLGFRSQLLTDLKDLWVVVWVRHVFEDVKGFEVVVTRHGLGQPGVVFHHAVQQAKVSALQLDVQALWEDGKNVKATNKGAVFLNIFSIHFLLSRISLLHEFILRGLVS